MEPLRWPVDWAHLTRWQRLMMDLPILGLRARVFKKIVAQLARRAPNASDLWSRFSPDELAIKQRIVEIAVKELEWPRGYFLPSDPFEIVIWDPTGDLATEAALDRMENELGLRRRSGDEWRQLASQTFGDVVQKIAHECAQSKK